MTDRHKASLGQRIKELRKQAGVTQDRLGEAVGISPKYLSGIERGRENPTLDTLLRLADNLRVEPFQLFLFGPEIDETQPLHRELERLLAGADRRRLHAVLTLLKEGRR